MLVRLMLGLCIRAGLRRAALERRSSRIAPGRFGEPRLGLCIQGLRRAAWERHSSRIAPGGIGRHSAPSVRRGAGRLRVRRVRGYPRTRAIDSSADRATSGTSTSGSLRSSVRGIAGHGGPALDASGRSASGSLRNSASGNSGRGRATSGNFRSSVRDIAGRGSAILGAGGRTTSGRLRSSASDNSGRGRAAHDASWRRLHVVTRRLRPDHRQPEWHSPPRLRGARLEQSRVGAERAWYTSGDRARSGTVRAITSGHSTGGSLRSSASGTSGCGRAADDASWRSTRGTPRSRASGIPERARDVHEASWPGTSGSLGASVRGIAGHGGPVLDASGRSTSGNLRKSASGNSGRGRAVHDASWRSTSGNLLIMVATSRKRQRRELLDVAIGLAALAVPALPALPSSFHAHMNGSLRSNASGNSGRRRVALDASGRGTSGAPKSNARGITARSGAVHDTSRRGASDNQRSGASGITGRS